MYAVCGSWKVMDKINRKTASTISAIKMVRPWPADRSKALEKSDHSRELNFVYSFRPIYYYSRLLGLMPFSIIYDSNKEPQKPKVRVSDGLWFVVSICFYCMMAIVSYEARKHSRNSSKGSSYVLILGDSFHLISGLLIGALTIAMDMCNRHKLVGILRKFTAFDREASLFRLSQLLIFLQSCCIFLQNTGCNFSSALQLQEWVSTRLVPLRGSNCDGLHYDCGVARFSAFLLRTTFSICLDRSLCVYHGSKFYFDCSPTLLYHSVIQPS